MKYIIGQGVTGGVHDDINSLICWEQITELRYRAGGGIQRFEVREIRMF